MKQVEGKESLPGAAFLPGGMLRFLSDIRPAGRPEPTLAGLLSSEAYAAELDKMFRGCVKERGG